MAGVYISYPFCSQKCTYCNFASGVFPRELESRYMAALELEIDAYAWQWIPETLYLGGGTPSQIPMERLTALLSKVPGRPWSEATMETAPGTITLEKLRAWTALGLNRVSLGVQSFNTRELARTGRRHTAATVVQDLAMLRAAGISNINIDLIAGLPGQTMPSWLDSLAAIEKLDPPHVSVYMLEVDDDSRLGQEVLLNGKRYGAPDVPCDALIADMYETAVERLAAIGMERYEISNFAKPGFESVHNLKYWRLEPYAGFGADAHSFDGVLRLQNVESPREYAARGERRENPRASATEANLQEEKFFVGLRLTAEGIRPAPQEWSRFEQPISRFIAEGLLESSGGALRLTPRGVLFSNEVFEEFITVD